MVFRWDFHITENWLLTTITIYIYFSLANTQTKAMVCARVWKLSCKVAWRMINESDGTPSTLDRSFFFGKLSQAWDAKLTCHSPNRGWSKHSETTIITISRQISEKHCQFFRKRAFISSKEPKKSLDKKKRDQRVSLKLNGQTTIFQLQHELTNSILRRFETTK